MTSGRRRAWAQAAGWTGGALLAIWIVASRLELTVDLAYFLPEPATAQERVLVERLGQGPGSQLIFVDFPVAGLEPAAASDELKARLAATALFSQVLNGAERIDAGSIPAVVWRNRYLLEDVDLGVDVLRGNLRARLRDMAVVGDRRALELIAADPLLTTVGVMEKLAWSNLAGDDAWVSAGGRSVLLIARTTAPAFDIEAQAAAVEAIRDAGQSVAGTPPELFGVGVYGAELQRTIRAEAQLRTLLAAAAIALVLLVAYRRAGVLAIAALPLLLGSLAGLAAVAALFGAVHGITLAFGFTLFGVAIDYPLHLLSHMRRRDRATALRLIWPTLRLGAFSTVVGYAAIALSGSRGLAQLGCFSAVGVLVALYATRTLLPDVGVPPPAAQQARERSYIICRHGLWLATLGLGLLLLGLRQEPIWSNDLASLTPLPPERLARDRELRERLGAPDIRYLVAAHADSLEGILRRTERVVAELEKAVSLEIIGGFQSVTALVPSAATQARRRQALAQASDLEARVRAAAEGTGLRPAAFARFVADVRRLAAPGPPLTPASFAGTPLEDYVAGKLWHDDGQWISLTTLHELESPDRLRALIAGRDVILVDLTAASQSLVARYRLRVITVLGIALLVIGGLLLRQIGGNARTLWIAGTLAASLTMTVAVTGLVLDRLSLFNLIATVLVAGLGLDYALFFSRGGHEETRDTRHALAVCAASTLAAFLVLAMSDVPILRGLGITVAVGVALCFATARLGLRRQ
ncbi:MMPL family transporter [soil metagenome]